MIAAALAGLGLGATGLQAALLVSAEFLDLTDPAPGEDRWRVSYRLSGEAFLTDEGFTIYFDHALYRDLTGPFPPLNSGWDLLLLQPDLNLPDDGFLDGLATADGPSLSDPFVVEFTLLGGGVPQAQAFETYSLAAGFTVTGSGTSDPTIIPEPAGGVWLLAPTALGLAWLLRAGRRGTEQT